jgi:hypothetical protein
VLDGKLERAVAAGFGRARVEGDGRGGRRGVKMLGKKIDQPGKRCRGLAVASQDPVEGQITAAPGS